MTPRLTREILFAAFLIGSVRLQGLNYKAYEANIQEHKGRSQRKLNWDNWNNRTLVWEEDPNEVEEFLVHEGPFPEGEGRSHFPNDDSPFGNSPGPFSPGAPSGDPFPFYPGSFGQTNREGFTAREAIRAKSYPGQRIRFRDIVTDFGGSWNNVTSEFVCHSPGIFFFTFTACGDRNQHFRITLKHNEIGIVSAYGDLNGFQMASNSALLRLFPRDRVYLQLDEGSLYEVSTYSGRAYNTFTGFRIV